MSWDFLLYVFCFFLQAGLLGLVMHGLIVLSDLENDFTNPHDASDSLNKWAVPEFILQSIMTGLLLVTGKWVTGGILVTMSILNWREYIRGDFRVHATDVFQKVNYQKKIRMGKLVFYLLSFVFLIYKVVDSAIHAFSSEEELRLMDNAGMLVESGVHAYVTHHDKQVAHRIVQQAAASFDI